MALLWNSLRSDVGILSIILSHPLVGGLRLSILWDPFPVAASDTYLRSLVPIADDGGYIIHVLHTLHVWYWRYHESPYMYENSRVSRGTRDRGRGFSLQKSPESISRIPYVQIFNCTERERGRERSWIGKTAVPGRTVPCVTGNQPNKHSHAVF